MINKKAFPLKNPLIVALDLDSDLESLKIADQLSEIVGGFKVGPRLAVKYGHHFLKEISLRGPLFIDNKYFDIPSTMLAAVKTSFEAGATLVTVHAVSGFEALNQLSKLETELNQIRPFKILCVTILTSWDQQSLPEIVKAEPISNLVKTLSLEIKKAGLGGIVCSPHEIELASEDGHYIVTPGIRFEMESANDQKRIMTPKEAIKKGAHALVVGRPILNAKNPVETATDYVMSIYE